MPWSPRVKLIVVILTFGLLSVPLPSNEFVTRTTPPLLGAIGPITLLIVERAVSVLRIIRSFRAARKASKSLHNLFKPSALISRLSS